MEQKTLYRSCENRILGGVCGGLGEYFEIDPVLIRLIFVLLTIAGGAGVLVYLIAWIIIPEDPTCKRHGSESKSGAEEIQEKATEFAQEIKKAAKNNKHTNDSRAIAGMVILAFGILFLLQNIFNFSVWPYFWPIVLIFIGLAIAAGSKK